MDEPLEVQLWIEAEHLAEDVTDFCNIVVYLSTGTRYALNCWTFDFFATARSDGELNASLPAKHLYMHPPDLFVQDLTRPTLEKVVVDMITQGRLPAHCRVVDTDDAEDEQQFKGASSG